MTHCLSLDIRYLQREKVTGDCLYADWFAAFLIPFLHRNNAIVVSPNYRLVPEHTGTDVLQDLSDFWTWFHDGGLTAYLSSQNVDVQLDFDHVLASGDSAGGYMALMSGLLQPRGSIKAILAQYPMTDSLKMKPSDFFGVLSSPPETLVAEHMKSVKQGVVVSSCAPPDRVQLSYVLSASGQYLDFFGNDKSMWPIHLLEEKKWVPPTWIHHGDVDAVVDIEDSKAFVEKCETVGGLEVRLEIRKGENHGFDLQVKEDEQPWLKEGLRWVEEKWLV
jgi:acetyl esterase/lipase